MAELIAVGSEKWPLTVENAKAFIDFAIDSETPREDLLAHPFMIAILQKGLQSTRFFAQVFIDSYYRPNTHQNEQYWDVVEDITIPYALLVCWRGFGKTTGGNTTAIQAICYQLSKFILVVSKTHDEASRITENIKLELICNRRIRAVFGSFKNSIRKARDVEFMEDADFDLMFSRRGWFACDPVTGMPTCFVMPKGCEQQVRGLSIYVGGKLWRPDLLLIDDLESRELLNNEKNRKRIQDWLFDDLLPVVPAARPAATGPGAMRWNLKPGERPPFRVLYFDTYKHEDSIVSHLLASEKWKCRVFPQSELRLDPDGKRRFYSLVPDLVSHEQVRVEVRDAMRRNKMDGYCREFMCLPRNPASSAWSKDMYCYYKERDERLGLRQEITRMVICDPSRGGVGHCPTGMLALGVDAGQHKIYVRKEVNENFEVEDVPGAAIDLCVETNSRLLFVEIDGPEDWLLNDFRDEIARRGVSIMLIPITARTRIPDQEYGTGREARKRSDSQGVRRYYVSRQIYHEEKLRGGVLEQQQLSWPTPKQWDVLDCLSHFKRACNAIGLYFTVRTDFDGPGFDADKRWKQQEGKVAPGKIVYLDPAQYNRMASHG